jgi:hypothetical protein
MTKKYPCFSGGLPEKHPYTEPIVLETVLESYPHDLVVAYNTGWNDRESSEMPCEDPHLRIATTKQLIDELAVRARFASTRNEPWTNYKVVEQL